MHLKDRRPAFDVRWTFETEVREKKNDVRREGGYIIGLKIDRVLAKSALYIFHVSPASGLLGILAKHSFQQ